MSFNIGTDKLKEERQALRNMAKGKGPNQKKAQKMLTAQQSSYNMGDDDTEQIDNLIDQAIECLEQLELDAAKKILETASIVAKDEFEKSSVYDLIAQVLLEEGDDIPRAIEVLKEAESFTPNTNYERLVTLGQLAQDEESLHYYQQGLNIIEEQLKNIGNKRKNESRDTTEMRAELLDVASTIMTSMAELYVTDLCDEERAESECERLLQEAVKTSPTNTEAFRALGNLRTIQGNKPQAVKYTTHAFKLLLQAMEQGRFVPEFLARVELAKQLLELECWVESTEMFVALLDEDEQIAEIWYYAGISSVNYARSIEAQYPDEAHDLLFAAAQYFVQAQKILKQASDQEMEEQIDNQLRSLNESGISVDDAKKAIRNVLSASEQGTLDDIVSDDEDMN